jgi:hypothetical protein
MANTYEPIATTTLGSPAPDVTFTSISGTYTDLIIAGNGIKSGDHGINVQFNSDTGSNYSFTYLYGDGSSAVSGRESNKTFASGGRLGTNGAVSLFHIMNYANTTTYKTMLSRGDNASSLNIAIVSLWSSTSAITTIKMYPGDLGNFDTGSTFTLYGIASA